MTFKEAYEQKAKWVEERLQDCFKGKKELQQTVLEAANYSLMAGGKRLRPILMKEAYEMLGGKDEEEIVPFMVAMEMIHTYSLVHDDLPAMDNDTMRRGKPTTHVKFGEDMAILAGDALLNGAFEMVGTAFEHNPQKAYLYGKAMSVLANKAGVFGMIGGQVVDVENTGKSVTQETLLFIYRLKTAALLEASLMVGAIVAGADEERVQQMEQIGNRLGMAFQIQDDILDVTSNEKDLGKPVHSDERNHKTTYVTLNGLPKSKEMVRKLSEEALVLLQNMPSNVFLEELVKWLIQREK